MKKPWVSEMLHKRNLENNPAKSLEARAKISASRKGKPTTLGKPCSLETRQKIAVALKGRTVSKEVRERLSATLKRKGIKPPDNHTWMRGEKHPNWRGGLTPARQKDYQSPEYLSFVKGCLERDNYTCQKCGAENGNGYAIELQVHHKLSYGEHPDLRYNLNNGMTLCCNCHNLTKSRRPKTVDFVPKEKICQICHKPFSIFNPKKYCEDCKKIVCEYCGVKFSWRNGKRNQRFCSRRCYSNWFSENMTGVNNPHWKGYTEKPCLNCGCLMKRRGNEALITYNKRQFCSLRCAYAYRKKPDTSTSTEIL